jgi:hypothetical protein
MSAPKNESFRHGTFFYSKQIDEFYGNLSEVIAYDAKSAFVQRTADDLRSSLRRTPIHEVITIASHVYEFGSSIRDDGGSKEPHIHVLWWSRNYSTGTTKILDDFFHSRKFRG